MLVVRCAMVLVIAGAAGCYESYPAPGACMLGELRSCTCDAGGPGWETCYGAVPAVWGACVCNSDPVADAGSDRGVSYRTTVLLDGSHSSDADGEMLTYHWTRDAVPPGSLATLDADTTAAPSFTPDLPGDYVVSLTVNDAIVASAPATITISAHDDAPDAVATVAANVVTAAPMTLDASATTDANSDPLAFTWSVTGPSGSTATPADPTAVTTTFVPDVDGAYQVSLAVDDGRMTSSVSKPVHSYHRLTTLPFVPYRADYDKALDHIIFLSGVPANALYSYDPVADTFVTVALAQAATSFSISPDGTRAIIGDGSGITIVNLTTMQITNRISTSVAAAEVVDPGDGWAYVFSHDPDYSIYGVRLSTSARTTGARAIYGDMVARWMPGTTSICATDQIFTQVFSFASGTTTLTGGKSPTIGTELWTSDDGTRVFSFAPTVYAADLTTAGQLRSSIIGVSDSSTTGTLLAIPASGGSGTEDEVIDVYGYPSLTYDHSVTLPSQLRNGAPFATHGRYVFMHADGVHYSVVVEVDPLYTSPQEWAVTNL